MQFAYQLPQVVNKLIPVSPPTASTKDVPFVFRCALLPMGSETLAFLRLP